MSAAVTTAAECVALGEAFMDEHDPDWWRQDSDRPIDLDALDLSDTGKCVLGQRCPLEVLAAYTAAAGFTGLIPEDFALAYDAYARHLSGLRGPEFVNWAQSHGFTADGARPGKWGDLTAEWAQAIRKRRAGL